MVGLAYEKNVNKYNFATVWKPFFNDLKISETTGINISNNIYKGSVIVVAADNLGSHEISGFIETFNLSYHFRKTCYVKNYNDDLFQKYEFRSKDNYESDTKMVPTVRNTHYKGFTQNSPLNDSKYFHVCNPGLPPCLAHDLFQGIVKYDINLCINR